MITLYETGFEPGRETYVNAPFVLSPDGTHVALTVSDEPYGDPSGSSALYPDGTFTGFRPRTASACTRCGCRPCLRLQLLQPPLPPRRPHQPKRRRKRLP